MTSPDSNDSKPQVDLTAAEVIHRQQVVKEYKWLKFSGFDTPDLSLANVSLEEVFVRLSLTVEKVIREPIAPENPGHTGQRESWQRERPIKVQEPIELSQALSNHLLIVGEPGAGKSTLLRWLMVTFAEARQRKPNCLGPAADADRLPVLVELGHLHDRYLKPERGETPIWHQYLPEYLTDQDAFANTPPQLLTQALNEGRCLLLFDGLDEIANHQVRTRIAGSLAKLASDFPGNRVIIGSRPAGESESESVLHPLQFHRCQIERFTFEDVQRFFHFWYALDRGLTPEQQSMAADALYARVQAAPATMQLATTPLLSTILVLIWRNKGYLPERRVELYEHCCRVLIKHWEASHDVHYQSVLADMDWEYHLHLLTPLAYFMHDRGQRTATREELVGQLAMTLQAEGRYNEQGAAVRAARQFLDTLGLRSGLLQYIGDGRFGFPHLTFQEYLVARYIASKPDPDYIDLVMGHLHEAWWQEVHLLTIAHLGSGPTHASKASALILTILNVYKPPWWILRSSELWWLRLVGPGKLLPREQLERRIAWMLAREFELAIKGYAQCASDGTTAKVGIVLSAQAASLARHMPYEFGRYPYYKYLETIAGQLSQLQINEAAVMTRLLALRNRDKDMWRPEVASLGQVGVGNEAEVSALLQVLLHDPDWRVRKDAAKSLGQIGTGNETAANALVQALHDPNLSVQESATDSLGQVGVGNEAVVNAIVWALLYDPSPQIQWFAASCLGQVGVGNKVVANALLQALYDQFLHPYQVIERVAASLGQVGVGSEEVVNALVQLLLHNADSYQWQSVRRRAAMSLGLVGAGNETVVQALLQALHDVDLKVRKEAVVSLGRLEVKGTTQLRRVLVALNRHLHDEDDYMRQFALESIRQLLDGRPIPGYPEHVWVPLRKRRAQKRRLKRVAFWLIVVALVVLLGLVATWLLGILNPNGFPVRFLAVLAGIIAFVAAIVQILGQTLRDPWEHP